MKKLILFLSITAFTLGCNVKFVPTKSDTALNAAFKIQQDANNAFYISVYNDSAYAVVNADIDSLISFDKSRVKSVKILNQDKAIKSLLQEFQGEHKTKGAIVESEQRSYKVYFKSVIDPRVISENSLK